jgi:hypothetical protein
MNNKYQKMRHSHEEESEKIIRDQHNHHEHEVCFHMTYLFLFECIY